jgi:hypothetical protein
MLQHDSKYILTFLPLIFHAHENNRLTNRDYVGFFEQVELSVTYEGSRFAVSDLRLLMDTFTLIELTGSWRRLFSKVKKHIIWSVLKSVTGMQVCALDTLECTNIHKTAAPDRIQQGCCFSFFFVIVILEDVLQVHSYKEFLNVLSS